MVALLSLAPPLLEVLLVYGRTGLLLLLAGRNLVTNRTNLAIAVLMVVGTFILTLGTGLLSSIDDAMRRSISGSVAGDVQVYSSQSLDELELWGAPDNVPDLAPIPHFEKWREVIAPLPNVKQVVPMGVLVGTLATGNALDVALGDLRILANQLRSGAALPVGDRYREKKAEVQALLVNLEEELQRTTALASDEVYEPLQLQALAEANRPQFWAGFDQAPFEALELMENRVAPLMSDPPTTFLRLLGTDLPAFQRAFDRLRIVEGEAVPAGRRGVLLSRLFHEDSLKLKTARRLDLLRAALAEGETIRDNPDLQRMVRDNQTNTRELVFQLHGPRARELERRLREELRLEGERLGDLLSALLTTDDANFQDRYQFFYQHIAPLVRLYRVGVGEVFYVKSLTENGYLQSAPLKLYGTFEFQGMEKADLAGAIHLMDLVSFRQLYGLLDEESQQELRELSEAPMLSREEAEGALFGEGSVQVVEGESSAIEEEVFVREGEGTEALLARQYTPQEMSQGLALHAAVLLEDPSREEEAVAAIEAAGQQAGLPVRAVPWRKAAGVLGNFAGVVGGALLFAVLVLFLVTLLIMNNTLVLNALRRTQEIGTLRALGVQRPFVVLMILAETLLLGTVAGGLGVLLAGAVVGWLGKVGLPAPHEQLSFFFAGPRLHPSIGGAHILGALAVVVGLSLVSTLYPALLASRVSPRRAMQAEE